MNLYLFWGDGCPHCAKEKAYLTEIVPKYTGVTLYDYEVYYNQNNVDLMQKTAEKLNINASGVPLLIIGNEEFIGFAEGTTDKAIESRIQQCLKIGCPDSIAPIVNPAVSDELAQRDTNQARTEQPADKKEKIVKLPLIGEVNALQFSLPVFTVILGAIDGFNPCAMWTLLFLISLLLGFKDRKKMWLLGSVFILVSGFVYFLFMAAWLKLILFLGFVMWVRWAIGTLALVGGSYSIKKGFANKNGGCEITGTTKRQATLNRMQSVVKSKSLWLALAGISMLAFAINLVELVCSAGLPAVYTQVLALSDLATWQYYGYILLYIFFFMLDDMIIFAVAMVTLRLTGISTKYSRYSSLAGGTLMVIIGSLLILKPQWLMFG